MPQNLPFIDIASPVSILQALIRCRSVTPDDGGAFDLLHNMLSPLGFIIARPRFSAPNTPSVENFYAKYESANEGKHLLFAGHVDVVPAGDEALWRFPPFAGIIADGKIFGRGAVDMKGGIACFIAALARCIQAGGINDGAVSLLLTADEEGPGINGAVKALQWARGRGETWDAALVGEPSSVSKAGDMIKIGRRGSLSAILRVRGRQGHVAYPQRAENPLPLLLPLLEMLLSAPLDEGNAEFQPSNLELTSIDTGNYATNIIPAQAEARFNIRFNSLWTVESLKAEVKRRLREAAAVIYAERGIKAKYDLDFIANPSSAFITHNEALTGSLTRAVRSVIGNEPELSTGGGTSDARFIKDYCPVAELGLTGATMHQTDECAELADLENLTQIYQNFLGIYFTE